MTRSRILLSIAALGIAATAWALTRPPAASRPAAPPVTSARLRSEGRVAAYPGQDVVVGTDAGGTLLSLEVQEGQRVRKGQVLALLDDRRERAALEEGRARVLELKADAAFQASDVARMTRLQASGVLSRQALEQAQTQLALAQARQQAAQATVDRLAVAQDKLRIVAPLDGVLLTRFAQPGETLAPGARLVQIARTDHLRVEAEIDEFDLARVRVGQGVEVRAEGLDQAFRGVVEEVPAHVVGRRLKPQDPGRPSDTRVLMVKVRLEGPTPLKLGQRVELGWE